MGYPNNPLKRRSARKWPLVLLALGVAGAAVTAYALKHATKNNSFVGFQVSSGQHLVDKQLPAVEAGLLPWQLSAPLSRMAVYSGNSSNQLIIAGGLTSANQSASGIYGLDTANGNLSSIGNLPYAVHDAAGAKVGGSYALFGGGVNASFSKTAVLNSAGQVVSSGNLPGARSDCAAVSIGSVTYIIGGYNGSKADPQVLSTTNGTTFKDIGNLPVPVRYPAVAASGQYIYVFGGEAAGGSRNGNPVNSVQIIDVKNGRIKLASWTLPVPLEGAQAFSVNGTIYLAGGQSTTPETINQGVGTTQVPGVNVQTRSLTYNTIWAVDIVSGKFLQAGILQLPVANAGVAVSGSNAWIVGGEYNGNVLSSVQIVTPNNMFGIAGQPGAGSPFYGSKLLVADRGNNRILVMDSSMNITWRYPSSATSAQAASAFYFPDDAFFTNGGTGIISNQENNNTIVVIGYPSGKLLWSFGHPLQAGSAYGYLRAPDDAYMLKNGDVVVADDQNCRVLFINPSGKVVGQIGTTGVCKHIPNVALASPNGDTPLYDGNVLISEIIGSWVSEYTPKGKMVWSVQLPISYPSDPQQLGAGPGKNPNHYLIADYADPGSIVQFTRQGKILSDYHVASGPGRLSYPSLVEMLPSGVYMANDDHRDRMVAIDPKTSALVWQYGVSDTPGTAAGMLHKPDGFDLLMSNNTTPTHGSTM